MIDDQLQISFNVKMRNAVPTLFQTLQPSNQSEVFGNVARIIVPDVITSDDYSLVIVLVKDVVPSATFSWIGLAASIEL